MILVAVLLIAALGAGAASLYREFYSPRAFVLHYLELLQEHRTAEALAVPGVAVDSAELEARGLPATASEALLRPEALTTVTDATVTDETVDGDQARVTVSYTTGGYSGTTTFTIEHDPGEGVLPRWRFARSPCRSWN